jgi:hypothetical protein
VDFGDGILGPTSGPIPVAGRVEIGLEDRLQDQLEGHLRDPVPQGRDTQVTDLAVLLGYHRLLDRQRSERPVPERRAQLVQERDHPNTVLDVVAGNRVHASCPGTPVARHPLPSHQQRGPVADQVEYIIEPATRLVPCPSVQLELVIEYPPLGREDPGRRRRRVVIQQRSFPTAAPLPSHCRPSPCDRLSRPPSTTATPPRSGLISGRRACPPPGRLPDGKGDARPLPTFAEDLFDGFGAQLYPGSIATDRTSQSWSGPPNTHGIKASGEDRPSAMAPSSTAKRPIHQVRQTADDSRDVNHWFSFLAPIPSSLVSTVMRISPVAVRRSPRWRS